MDQVLTVFLVRNQTTGGIIEAMRNGRFYATGQKLRHDTFRVECNGGQRTARSGEALDQTGTRDVTVRLSVTATGKGAHPISVTIIRSGQVVSKVAGVTPFEQQFVDATVSPETWNFYRVVIEGDGEILSNPIFVGPVPAESDRRQQSTISS
nr:hypothetical protein [Nitrospirota bacterium]